MWRDIRYAARVLARQPGSAVVAMLTVALGIAATTVLFSLTWNVLMKPLPWPDQERLVRVVETREGSTRRLPSILTNGTYLAWRESASTVEELAAWSVRTATLEGAGDPQRARVASMTASGFRLLRGQPLLGTVFTDADEPAGTAIVLSHGFWQQQYGGRRDVLGRTLQVDGRSVTIVAVMPPAFVFPDRETRAWLPFEVRPVLGDDPNARYLSMFGAMARLRPGVTPEQAAAEATARGRTAPDGGMTAIAVFGSRGAPQVTAVPVLDAMTAEVKPALLVLLAAVGLLLLTATANIASVQLARATARRREIAVRAALGASAARLTRQVLVENAIIGVSGGLLGLALAAALHRSLPAVLPADFPRAADVALNPGILAFALVLSGLASVGFGLLPALQARRVDLVAGLTSETVGGAPLGRRLSTLRARKAIMALQVAIACILLVGAALLVRSFRAMIDVDRGYDTGNVLTARLPLPDYAFSPARRSEVVTALLARLASNPEVRSAGITTVLPLGSGEQLLGFSMPSRDGGGEPVQVSASLRVVSAQYFEAMGMRLGDGRAFTSSDTASSLPVVVVNRAFARRYLGGTPLGTRLPAGFDDKPREWEVVGVIEDARSRSVTEAAHPEIFVPYSQLSVGLQSDPVLVVRTHRDAEAFAATLRALVREQAPSVALDGVMTMDERLAGSLARPRLYAVVLGGFAGFSLAIAAVGLFGVLSYSVAQRSREMALRSALGARPADLIRMVMREGLVITAIGAFAGLWASLLLARSISAFLYGIRPHDPATFAGVPALLLVIAAAACFVPARRAVRESIVSHR